MSPPAVAADVKIIAMYKSPLPRKTVSLKISYSGGTYVRFGGNYQNVSFAWQYSWIGKP
jgi:hypothetical protein